MIRILSIFLLLSYLLVQFQFVIPYAEYYYNYEQIVSEKCVEKDIPNSCCKGSCHIEKQLVKSSENQKEQDIPLQRILNEWLVFSSKNTVDIKSKIFNNDMVKHFYYYTFIVKTGVKQLLDKPPIYLK